MKREGKPNKPERVSTMKYKFTGTLKIKFPENGLFEEGETKEEALCTLIEELASSGLENLFVMDELEVATVRKVFKVAVREVFTHMIEIDTDEYPDVEDEMDAERLVRDNLVDFTDDFEYNYYDREDFDTDCDSCDTREYEDKEYC